MQLRLEIDIYMQKMIPDWICTKILKDTLLIRLMTLHLLLLWPRAFNFYYFKWEKEEGDKERRKERKEKKAREAREKKRRERAEKEHSEPSAGIGAEFGQNYQPRERKKFGILLTKNPEFFLDKIHSKLNFIQNSIMIKMRRTNIYTSKSFNQLKT